MAARTSTTTAAQQSSDPHDPNNSQTVSSRRLKKREIDRRCQRQARERTKSRIAYLEGLVEDFRHQDSSGQVATLMRQLQDIEVERDAMSKTLKDIQKAMEIHKASKAADDRHARESSTNAASHLMFDDADDEDQKPNLDTLSRNIPFTATRSNKVNLLAEPTLSSTFDLANFEPMPITSVPSPEILFGPHIERFDSDSPQSTSQTLVRTKPIRDPDVTASVYANAWATSNSDCTCNNCHGPDRAPGQKSVWRGSYWKYANEVLSERFDWDDQVGPTSDAMCDDVPVRAVLEGWDAVERRGPLHPSWHILKRIDQLLFQRCAATERLAILRAMHTLLQFHTEASSERYSRLPPWYMRRPAQKIAHSYAIDFFAWPGVRERFIFNEHDYCGNEFWDLFCVGMRVLWPYEFRDCYTREVGTGLYKVSAQFDERLRDIKCWAMGPEMFERFPELYSDIPAFNSIPPNMSSNRPQRLIELPSSPPKSSEKPESTQQKKKSKTKVRPQPQPQPQPQSQSQAQAQVQVQTQNQPPPRAQVQAQAQAQAQAHSQAQARVQVQAQTHVRGHAQTQPPHPSFPIATQHVQQTTNLYQYNLAEYQQMSALDAFAYGTVNETDFAAMYHPEDLEGYPNIMF